MNLSDLPRASLAELAARYGVAERYHSFWGEDLAVSEEALRQALGSMGVDPHRPAEADAGLPPVFVAREGDGAWMRWSPAQDEPAAWSLWPEERASGEPLHRGEAWWDEGRRVLALPKELAPG